MRGAAAGRRRNRNESSAVLPPSSLSGRDSDASYCSSRPSSVGMSRSTDLINDRSYQQSALRSVNDFLSTHSASVFLRPPLPSAKDITEAVRFIIARLDFRSSKLDEDLQIILKQLNCPVKLNRSALRAPGTPHTWPTFLAVLHWLVQISMYNDHISSLSSHGQSAFQDNSMISYSLNSYFYYIRGDDDTVEALDREFLEKLEQERDSVAEKVNFFEKEATELETKLERLRLEPSDKEVLEKDRAVLEEDVNKFHAIIGEFSGRIANLDKVLEEKGKELEAKVAEKTRICEENEELKKRTEVQAINARDAERMKRELQSVERDIGETEVSRNMWEEKVWDLDAEIGQKFKEIGSLSIDCNQAMRRLKLGNGFQYAPNDKGSTPAEILGIDYKLTLKPALESLLTDIKKASMEKAEELISLQQSSVQIASKIEGKRKRNGALQSHIHEVEAQLSAHMKGMQDYVSTCAVEARRMIEAVEADSRKLDAVEREAAEMLKVTKLNKQKAMERSEEEVQKCAFELFALIDLISRYKEYVSSKISEMKNELSETATAVSNAYKSALPVTNR